MEPILKLQLRPDTRIYPGNDYARNYAQMLGTKTFSLGTVARLKELGHVIVWIPFCGPVHA